MLVKLKKQLKLNKIVLFIQLINHLLIMLIVRYMLQPNKIIA